MAYAAPLADLRFILDHVVPLAPLSATGHFPDTPPELVEAVLDGAARLATEVFAPLDRVSDTEGARLIDGAVRTPAGFAAAYRALAEGGWVGVSAPVDHGGMGLPLMLNTAVQDMLAGACLALQLNPMLTQGQIEALEHHASPEIKELYLPRLISGDWSGTMNLTEPQAGSDVGALRTRAVPNGDGTYAVTGQKIYISWGDSDLTENICHLVLARLPDAAPGTRGISLFLVPKFLPDAAGNPGARNAVSVVGLEHKTGLHGSPTCVMSYDGATGWLVGAEHKGMAAMFTMMNAARLAVGVQGVGAAEAATQRAVAYARDRVQAGPILGHADVRRMLATMRAEVFAARALTLACAAAIDMGRATRAPDWQARAALLTPIAKAWGTEVGCRVAEMGVQVHGGMGYVEESGASQHYRDVRVTAIYEGTNGIQAMDLVGRKMQDGGAAALALIDEIASHAQAQTSPLAPEVAAAAQNLRAATLALVAQGQTDRFAGAMAYLTAFARVLGAHFHLCAAVAEGGDGPRSALAAVYVRRLLPAHAAALAEARAGAADLYALTPEDLGA